MSVALTKHYISIYINQKFGHIFLCIFFLYFDYV